MAILTRNQSSIGIAPATVPHALGASVNLQGIKDNTRGRLQENISLELPKKDSMIDLGIYFDF